MRLPFGLLLAAATLAGDATGDPLRTEPATDDCYNRSANLMGTAGVDTKTPLPEVIKQNELLLAETLEEAPALASSHASNCGRSSTRTPYEAGGVTYTFPPNTEKPRCRSLMTKTIDSALNVMTADQSHQTFDPSKAPFLDISAQQMPNSGSNKIGCAMTKDCQRRQNVLFYKLNPIVTKDSRIFRQDFFYERYASGLDLSTLSPDDIARAAAAVGEPSLLLLGAAAAAAAAVALTV